MLLACNDAVEDIFRKAVAVDPRERWADAGVFWGALECALRESGVVEIRRPAIAAAAPAYRPAQESKTRPGPYGAVPSPRRAAIA